LSTFRDIADRRWSAAALHPAESRKATLQAVWIAVLVNLNPIGAALRTNAA
jgi:hypothetical protein